METDTITAQNTEADVSIDKAPTHPFNSISDTVKDEYFINFVGKTLNELLKKRRDRPDPKPGLRYKRDWYDRMRHTGKLNTAFFTKNIEDIWHKRSRLNAEERGLIQFVCNKAYQLTLIAYSEKAALEKANTITTLTEKDESKN